MVNNKLQAMKIAEAVYCNQLVYVTDKREYNSQIRTYYREYTMSLKNVRGLLPDICAVG